MVRVTLLASGWETVARNRAMMSPHSVCDLTTVLSFSRMRATPAMSCSETALSAVDGRLRRTSRAMYSWSRRAGWSVSMGDKRFTHVFRHDKTESEETDDRTLNQENGVGLSGR